MNTPWYTSSAGNGLSATVFGFSVLGIAQAFSTVASLFHHPVDQDTIVALINAIIVAIGTCVAVFGLLRKLVNQLRGLSA